MDPLDIPLVQLLLEHKSEELEERKVEIENIPIGLVKFEDYSSGQAFLLRRLIRPVSERWPEQRRRVGLIGSAHHGSDLLVEVCERTDALRRLYSEHNLMVLEEVGQSESRETARTKRVDWYQSSSSVKYVRSSIVILSMSITLIGRWRDSSMSMTMTILVTMSMIVRGRSCPIRYPLI